MNLTLAAAIGASTIIVGFAGGPVLEPCPSIQATNVFFYYKDVEAAARFYRDVIGLEPAADWGFAKMFRVSSTFFLVLVDLDTHAIRGFARSRYLRRSEPAEPVGVRHHRER